MPPLPSVGRSATNDLQCINMTTAWLLLLVNIAATWCCSTIHVTRHVSPPDGATETVIGRTMELGDLGFGNFGGLLFGADPSDPSLTPKPVQDPYTISVHRRGEEVGKVISALCESCKPWKTKLGNPNPNPN